MSQRIPKTEAAQRFWKPPVEQVKQQLLRLAPEVLDGLFEVQVETEHEHEYPNGYDFEYTYVTIRVKVLVDGVVVKEFSECKELR